MARWPSPHVCSIRRILARETHAAGGPRFGGSHHVILVAAAAKFVCLFGGRAWRVDGSGLACRWPGLAWLNRIAAKTD